MSHVLMRILVKILFFGQDFTNFGPGFYVFARIDGYLGQFWAFFGEYFGDLAQVLCPDEGFADLGPAV